MESIREFQRIVPYNIYNDKHSLEKFDHFDFENSYEFQEFVEFKKAFYAEQDSLFENINQEDWSKTTKDFTAATYIIKNGKQKFENFTRPWPKIYEILEEFPLISFTTGQLNTLHLEEKIGAMVCAVNHYLKSNRRGVTWNWRATHENPYYEDNKNESLVEYYPSNDNLLSCTYENWVFGEDYTGNICDSSNIRFLIKKCEQLGEVSFITADGSINTHLQPKQKENILYILHYSELVAALSILSDGGNFVWKVFTIFQENMISLLYLLNLVFGKITLFKPLSGPVHSFEMFVVCQNFQKRTTNLDELLEQMINSVGNKNPIFPKDFIPQAFLQEHLEKMKYFTSNQLALLRKFLMFARDPHGTEARRHLSISKQVAWEFFRHYNISPISQRNRLINFENSYKTLTTIQGGLRIEDLALTVEEINSFNEIDNIQRKEIVCRKLWAFGPKIHPYNRESELPKINVLELDPICGKPIENVTSSMFIVTIPFKVGLLIEQQFQGSLLGLSGLDVSCLVGTTEVKFEFHENFGKSEKKFLKTILEKFIQMKPNRILFQNFYFLTHFAVSVLATFMFFYEECAMDESNVFLRKYLDYGYSDEIILLQKILDSDTFDNIVSLVPPNRIQRNRFAVKLIHFNTFLLTSHLKKFVQNL